MARNPDTQVRRVLDARFPGGFSDRGIARLAGVEKIMFKFDTAARQGKVPDSEYVKKLAQAIGTDVVEVLDAALIDAGYSLDMSYSHEQHRAARLVGEIPAERRGEFVDGVELLVQAMRSPAPSSPG